MIVFSIVLAAASEFARSEEKLRVTSNYHAVFYGKEEAVKNSQPPRPTAYALEVGACKSPD